MLPAVLLFVGLISALFSILPAQADDYTGTSYTARDPVLYSASYSTSTSFQLFSTMGQIATGTSTASSYNMNSGFLYFPVVSTPIIVATPGANQVALSWTSAVGYLGWNVSGYDVGQAAATGGPYSFSSVGNVLSSTRSSLTAGTAYYFVVRAKDSLGNFLATSTEVSATPTAPVATCGNGSCSGGETCSSCPADCGTCPSGGGGGGGGAVYVPPAVVTGAVFSGRAYPKSTVTLLKDAQVSATTVAGTDANFQISLTGLTGGTYIFSLYSEDYQGRRSSLVSFPVSITTGATTNISGIFIAPTIAVDKEQVKRGDNIAIFGQSAPTSEIVISVNSDQEYFGKVNSDTNGVYLFNFDTTPLEYGQHYTKSKSSKGGEVSSYGTAIGFAVGTKNVVTAPAKKCPGKGDVNSDCRVNLVDFSIAAYWWKRPLTEAAKANVDAKLWPDDKIDLRDFSIMAYYWTG